MICAIRWSAEAKAQQQLLSASSVICDIEEPDDLMVPLDDYTAAHGHPHSNGQGHRIVEHNGQKMVIVPGERIWKVKRKRRQNLTLQSVVNDGSEVWHQNQLESQLQDGMMDIFGTSVVGQSLSLDAMIGGNQPHASAPAASGSQSSGLTGL